MSYYNGPKIVTNGLVVHLDPLNIKSYNIDYTPLNIQDISGNNNTAYYGTLSQPSFSNGVITIPPSESNGYFQITDNSNLRSVDGFTLSMVVKFNNLVSGSYKNLIGKPNYSKYGIIVEWYGNNPLLADFYSGGSRNSTDLIYPSLTDWNYIVHSYDKNAGSGNQKFYVWNSSNKTSNSYTRGTLSVDTSTENMIIGQGGLGLSIGCVSVYNRGINHQEILQNYNALKSRFNI